MTDTNRCKGCMETVRLSKDDIAKIADETVKNKNARLVNEKAYRLRLDACENCDALQYGTTCRFCGCLVQVKAWLTDAKCPHPYGRKW